MRNPRLALTAACALGLVVLLDVVRVWLPSVLFVYGDAGSTPATQMGLFALIPFVLAFAGVVGVRLLGQRAVAVGAATALVVCRLALQATAGGEAQLWWSTAGVVAGLVWLVALAAATTAGDAAVGLIAGLAADAGLHTVLRSASLAWRDGALPWVPIVTLGATLLALTLVSPHPTTTARRPDAAAATGRPRGWVAFGAVLVLHAIVTGMPSRVHTITGWSEVAAAVPVLVGHAIAVAVGLAAVRAGGAAHRLAALVGPALVLGGLALALAEPAAAVVAGHLVLPAALAASLAAALRGAGRPVLSALACAGGLLLFVLLAFGYYATYDIALPVTTTAVLAAAALVAAGIGVASALRPARRDAAARTGTPHLTAVPDTAAAVGAAAAPLLGVLALAIAVVLGTGVIAVRARPPAPQHGAGYPVRIMLYNVRMGFDLHGAQAVARQTGVIAGQRPDIVALNEVSRGWFTNASNDGLPRMAHALGLELHFGPGADRVWGNAILSRYPVPDGRTTPLPQGGAAMRRAMMSAVVDLGGGRTLGVVATHLHHRSEGGDIRAAQLQLVADEARRLHAGGRPVVVIGDLNAAPDDPELEPLRSWLVDASAGAPVAGTFPSDAPREHIDHIFTTPDLVARDFAVTTGTASDHLGVAVTLDLGG